MRRVVFFLSLMLIISTSALRAQNAPKVMVSGAEVERRTKRVISDYKWSHTYDDLKKRAEKEGKLMFYMQLVGNLDGGL